jgi:hypothetical protein
MDLTGWTIQEDTETHVRLTDGARTILLAKAGLSAGFLQEIEQHFYAGGEVQPQGYAFGGDVTPYDPNQFFDQTPFIPTTMIPGVMPFSSVNPDAVPTIMASDPMPAMRPPGEEETDTERQRREMYMAQSQAFPAAAQPVPDQAAPPPPPATPGFTYSFGQAPPSGPAPQEQPYDSFSFGALPGQQQSRPEQPPVAQQPAQQQAQPSPYAAGVPADPWSLPTGQEMPQQPKVTGGGSMDREQQKGLKELESIYGAAQAQAYAKADTDAALAQAQMETQQQVNQEIERRQAVFSLQREEWNQRGQILFDDIKNAKIDPNHFWQDKSTGQKIMAVVGMALGAGGAAATGSPNFALQTIQGAVDRDIDAQKANLGKLQSLYGYHIQQGNDDLAANRLARADALDIAAGQIEMNKLKFAGAQAHQAADSTVLQLRRQAVMDRQATMDKGLDTSVKRVQLDALRFQRTMMQKAAERQAMLTMAAKGGNQAAVLALMPDEQRKRSVFLMGGQVGEVIGGEPDRAVVNEATKGAKDVFGVLGEIRRLHEKPMHMVSPNDRKRMEQIKRSLVGTLRLSITGPGVMTEQDRKLIEDVIPDATSVQWPGNFDVAWQTLYDKTARNLEGAYQTHVIGAQQWKVPRPWENR